MDVAIVGGGIAGLSAAFELARRRARVVVLEAGARPGGLILTERAEGFTIDAGPDSLLVQKPGAVGLCRDLGLEDRLVPVCEPRTAWVLRGGRLHRLPRLSMLGIPTQLRPLMATRLLSLRGRLRAAREILTRPRPAAGDESIGRFMRRHFGDELTRWVAEPLLAGIHAGDIDALSIQALFPALAEAERRQGSVIRAFGRRVRRLPAGGPFRALPGGIGELVDALIRGLPDGTVRTSARAVALRRGADEGFLVESTAGTVRARRVILAVPAYAAADLLQPLDAALAARCRGIPYTSSAVVVLAYPRPRVRHPLAGTGFLVPRAEPGVRMMAATWVSSKWPGRAPPGMALMRVFFGGARDPDAAHLPDGPLVALGHGELARVLRIDGEPALARVYRWPLASAQHVVGHLERMAAIDAGLTRWPGLHLTGSGFRATGIADCIADARAVAARALAP